MQNIHVRAITTLKFIIFLFSYKSKCFNPCIPQQFANANN